MDGGSFCTQKTYKEKENLNAKIPLRFLPTGKRRKGA
jgi:hypothetical protein